MDPIASICYGNDRNVLDMFYRHALLAMRQYENDQIRSYVEQLKTGEYVDDIMKKVIFFMVLNRNDWMKSVVCSEEQDLRGDLLALDSDKSGPFFSALVGICEDFISFKTDPTQMIERVKLAYEGRDYTLKQTGKVKAKRKTKRAAKQPIEVCSNDEEPIIIQLISAKRIK